MNWVKDKDQDGKLTVAITVLIAGLFVVLLPFYSVTPQSQPRLQPFCQVNRRLCSRTAISC